MLNISEIGELERRYLTRLRLNDTDLPADKFDRRTCVQRNVIDEKKAKKIQQIKNRINDAVARIYATMLPLAETEEYTLILDGREAKTTAALQKFSSILASSILSPNVSVESASALKEAGVSAWAGRVEDFLKFMEQRPLLSLIYLDHTGAFPPRHWQVRRSFQFLASSGGVIAFTFSTRSGRWLDEDNKEVLAPPPLSTWGGGRGSLRSHIELPAGVCRPRVGDGRRRGSGGELGVAELRIEPSPSSPSCYSVVSTGRLGGKGRERRKRR